MTHDYFAPCGDRLRIVRCGRPQLVAAVYDLKLRAHARARASARVADLRPSREASLSAQNPRRGVNRGRARANFNFVRRRRRCRRRCRRRHRPRSLAAQTARASTRFGYTRERRRSSTRLTRVFT